MRKLTVDSSVIVASLLPNEPRHNEAYRIWESVLSGVNVAIMPYSIFVEVVAAVKRRTGSIELSRAVMRELRRNQNIIFVDLDLKAAEESAEIAVKTGVRGMDAIVIQVAKDFGSEMITFDQEMMEKAKAVFD
jgi:predicted nucleic acid-binding protein